MEPGLAMPVQDGPTGSEPLQAAAPPIAKDPPGAPEVMSATDGLDASCQKDEDCIATLDGASCGCCSCETLLVTSKASYEWLMDELAREQCDDSWCATVDCEACPPPPAVGPAVCRKGACVMIVP